MSDGWPTQRLGDLVTLNPDQVPTAERQGQLTYIDIGAVSESRGGVQVNEVAVLDWDSAPSRARRAVRAHDVLVSTVRPYLRGFGRVPPELDGAVASTGFAVLRAGPAVLPAFVWAIVRSEEFVQYLVSRQTGANYPAVRPDDIASYEVRLPPLEVQARIGEVVGAIEAVVDVHREAAAAAANLLAGLKDQLIELDNHEVVPAGEVLLRIEGGRSPLAEDRPPRPGEQAVIKVSAVQPDRFVPAEAKTLAEDVEMPERARVVLGDVLVTRANTAALVGAVCQVREPAQDLFLSDKTLRLTFDSERVHDRFAVHALATSVVRRRISQLATGTSASMKNISQEKLRTLPLRLPSLTDQVRIAAALDAVAEAAAEHAGASEAAERLRRDVAASLLGGLDSPSPGVSAPSESKALA